MCTLEFGVRLVHPAGVLDLVVQRRNGVAVRVGLRRGLTALPVVARLLEIVGQRVREAGWQPVNIDATVVAEVPKLMPHRIRMQQAMAACLGIEADRVSVKATTAEKMGFVGRREGMAAWAVATVRVR